MKKRGAKKAQITLFAILAIVILAIVIVVILIVNRKPDIDDELKEESVPEEFKPVKDHVENCIHLLGVEAIKKIGEHGGYIDPYDPYISGRTFKSNLAYPTLSELISLSEDDDAAVPYYLHVPGKASYRNYLLASEAPSISHMEAQLRRYINKNLPRCVDFKTFEQEKGFFISSDDGNVESVVEIKDDKIDFFVTYNLNITKQGVKTKITKFDDIVRFPLKKYYDYAYAITASEFVTQYLEGFSRALIQFYGGADFSRLPPIYARTNKPYVVTWSKAKVVNDLQGLMISYVPVLRVKDTKGYQQLDVPAGDPEAAFYNYFALEIFNEPKPEIEISFFYTGQNIEANIQPSQGDTIRPSIRVNPGNTYIPQSNENNYNFYYDLSFPVVVEIRGFEPETEIQEYSYVFGLESNLIENKRVLEWVFGQGTVDWDPAYFEITGDYELTTADGETYKPRPFTQSLFCDKDTWLSGDMRIDTKDGITNQPLEDVSLVFGCGDYDECWVGNTELVQPGNRAEWVGKMPVCEGGYLMLTKYGYGSKTIMLSPKLGINDWQPTQSLFMKKEINVSVKKIVINQDHVLDGDDWTSGPLTLNPPTNLDANTEQVILTLTQTGFAAGTSPVSASAIFGKNGDEKVTIELIPGEYEVRGMFIDFNGIVIPKECMKVCTTPSPLGCLGSTKLPEDDIDIDDALWGGVELSDGTTGAFTISINDLENHDEIEFYVFELPEPKCLVHLQDMSKIATYSKTYETQIWPQFI